MTAKLYVLPGGDRNPQLVMLRRRALLQRPDVQEKIAELDQMLREYRAAKEAVKEADSLR